MQSTRSLVSVVTILTMVMAFGCAGAEDEQSVSHGPRLSPLAVLEHEDQVVGVDVGGMGHMELLVTQDEAPEVGDSFGDDYTLAVTWASGSATYSFHTSYGVFRLEVIDLTSDGTPELVLVKGRGRGTSVRFETLQVLTIDNGKIEAVQDARYSGWFGSGARWWYEHEYVDMDDDDLVEIELTLDHTPLGEGGVEGPHFIPEDRTVILRPFSAQ